MLGRLSDNVSPTSTSPGYFIWWLALQNIQKSSPRVIQEFYNPLGTNTTQILRAGLTLSLGVWLLTFDSGGGGGEIPPDTDAPVQCPKYLICLTDFFLEKHLVSLSNSGVRNFCSASKATIHFQACALQTCCMPPQISVKVHMSMFTWRGSDSVTASANP